MKLLLLSIKLHTFGLFFFCFLFQYDIHAQKIHKKSNYKAVHSQLEFASNHYANAEFNKSNTAARLGLTLLESEDNVELRFNSYVFLSANYTRLLLKDSAIYFYEKANQLINKNPTLTKTDTSFVVMHWLNQGAFYRENMNFKRALFCFQKCLQLQLPNSAQYLLTQENIANLFDYTGEHEKAYQIYNQILRFGKIQNNSQKINLRSSLGWNLIGSEKYVDAKREFEQAYKTYHLAFTKSHTQPDTVLLAQLYYQLGLSNALCHNRQKSEYYLDKSIAIQSNRKTGIYLAWSYEQKALNSKELGDLDNALYWLQKGLLATVYNFKGSQITQNPSSNQTALGEHTLFRLLSSKAKFLYLSYQKNSRYELLQIAAKTYQLAITIAEKYREEIDSQEDKLYFTHNNIDVFHEAMDVVFEWYSLNPSPEKGTALLQVMESNKAVGYNDLIENERVLMPKQLTNLVENKAKLITEIGKINQELMQNNKDVNLLKKQLQDKELALMSIKNELSEVFPIDRMTSNDISIKEIAATLSPKMAYINYTLGDSNVLYILIIKKGFYTIKKVYIKHSLVVLMNQLLPKLHENPYWLGYTGSKETIKLYDVLIKPFENELEEINRLVICRDGILNYLPFEILEQGKQKNDYLLARFAITYTFSAFDFLTKQQQKIEFKQKTLNVMPFLKDFILPTGDTLIALQNKITQKRNNDWLIGDKATKNRWLTQIGNYNRLNLITHSETDPDNPAQAYIYFYPDSSEKEYKLGFFEILGMSLKKQQLFVLASCNTDNGVIQTNEGNISLAYAFMRAGGQAVVGASWVAHNRACAFISQAFERYLDEGFPKDIALQRAKLDFINAASTKDLDHPFYWANLTLIGNNQALSPAQSYLFWYIYAVLVLIGMGVLIKKGLPKKFANRA